MQKKIMQKNRLDQFYQTPEQLINILPIPAVVMHRSGTMIYINNRFAELYQYTIKEMSGRKIQSFSDTIFKKIVDYFDAFDRGEKELIIEDFYAGRYYQIMIYPILNQYYKVESIYALKWDISKIKRLQQMSNQHNKRSKEQLLCDPLTGALNDYAFEDFLIQKRQKSAKQKISVFLIDIDHFAAFNVEYGFVQSNQALRNITETFQQELRSEDDLLVKLTGDRFLIVLPEMTQYTSLTVAERLRNSIESLDLKLNQGESQRLTISILIHTTEISQINSINHFIHLLDHQLRQSKKNGRNRCFMYSLS